jgi:phage baseplate assembly protein gpV
MSQRHGVVPGFVTAIDAVTGSVQVRFSSIEDHLESTWAPVAGIMSGKGRGGLFMPEPGDEVLVAFGDGQFDTPYVVGCLWNGEQTSPHDQRDHRVLVTPGGHELRFVDTAGDTRVILKSASGNTITLEDSKPSAEVTIAAGSAGTVSITLATVPPGVTVTDGVNQVTLGPSGISVTSATAVSITAPSVVVTAPAATFSGAVTCGTLTCGALACAGLTTPAAISCEALTVSSAVQCQTLVATTSVTTPVVLP